jgi:hypothetical protein
MIECAKDSGHYRWSMQALPYMTRVVQGGETQAPRPCGGLSNRNARVVTEFINAHLGEEIALQHLADQVGGLWRTGSAITDDCTMPQRRLSKFVRRYAAILQVSHRHQQRLAPEYGESRCNSASPSSFACRLGAMSRLSSPDETRFNPHNALIMGEPKVSDATARDVATFKKPIGDSGNFSAAIFSSDSPKPFT